MSESECPRCNENGIIVHFTDPADDKVMNQVIVPWALVEKVLSEHLDEAISNLIDVGSLE